jgi:hypothetical protein
MTQSKKPIIINIRERTATTPAAEYFHENE